MIDNLNNRLNKFLKNEKISKENFDDLKNVANYTDFDEKILSWFRCIQNFEVIGWRNKKMTKNICQILKSGESILYFVLHM